MKTQEKEQNNRVEPESVETIQGRTEWPLDQNSQFLGVNNDDLLRVHRNLISELPHGLLKSLIESIQKVKDQAHRDGHYGELFSQATERSTFRSILPQKFVERIDSKLIWSFLFLGGDWKLVANTFKKEGIDPQWAFQDNNWTPETARQPQPQERNQHDQN